MAQKALTRFCFKVSFSTLQVCHNKGMDEPKAQENVTGDNLWPGRFHVKAEITYRDRRGKPASMHVIFYRPEISAEEAAVLLKPLGFKPGTRGYKRLVSQVQDTFSEQQAQQLQAYLEKRRGTKVRITPAVLPSPEQVGASALPGLPSFRDGSSYRVYTEPGYSLAFKVESINLRTYIAMAHLVQEMTDKWSDE